MLLESSPETAAQLRSWLLEIGITVVDWANRGNGWLPTFLQHRPHFLLVDFVLPQKNGLTCLQKALETDGAVTAVFSHPYKGLLANELELKAAALGAVAILQKPLTKARVQMTFDRLKDHAVDKRLTAAGLPMKLS